MYRIQIFFLKLVPALTIIAIIAAAALVLAGGYYSMLYGPTFLDWILETWDSFFSYLVNERGF